MNDLPIALLTPDRWPTFVLVSARVGGLMMVAPLWSMTAMPHAVRAAITVVLAALLAASAPVAPMPAEGLDAILPIGADFAVGIAIGLATLLLVQLAMALLGRAVPQLNALMTAFPVTIGVGLVVLGLSLPLIASSLDGAFSGVPARTSHVIQSLAPADGSR
jgi:flagellar biosynthetic protein FliR